jgi:Flp pilus assembly protein TadG
MTTRRHHRSRGQGLAEFALVLPVFLLLVLGVVDIGRVVWATTSLNSASREAARFAIVHGGSESNTCPIGPQDPDFVPKAEASCVFKSPSKQYIYDTAAAAVIAGGTNVVVTACYGAECTGNTDTGDNGRGTPVTVTVSSDINLVTPAFLGMTSFTVSGTSTMLVNH